MALNFKVDPKGRIKVSEFMDVVKEANAEDKKKMSSYPVKAVLYFTERREVKGSALDVQKVVGEWTKNEGHTVAGKVGLRGDVESKVTIE